MPPLTFEFRLDPAETVRVSRWIRRRQPFAWWPLLVWPVLFGLAALYLLSGVPIRDLWRLGLVGLFLATLTLAAPWIQRWQLRRAYAATPTLREPQIYRFEAEGVSMIGGAATTILRWDAITEALELDDVFLLFYSKRCAYYLPKRAMGESEVEAVRSLLKRHLGARAAGLQ